MVTLADSLISSSSRPLSLRMRKDLTVRLHHYQSRPYWVVKEPIGLKYFRFQPEEYFILKLLDGQISMEEIKERFESEYAPQKIGYPDLQQFIGHLHRSGLVISEATDQGRQLWLRRGKQLRKKRLATLSNVFAIRWRGVDPERFFNWIYPYTGWFFSRAAVAVLMLVALAALTLVLVQFPLFQSRLPGFHEFFGPSNWLWLGLSMAVIKILHEFGHGLSCKRFGGECHELGFMLLVFTPALYCNVSDSWMLPSKWKRAAIGAAGIYVELVIASLATFIWWFSEPGLLNHLCLNAMFICSVSTVMFNGNPLLRFDGYYILADLSEIPNLRQKATQVLRQFVFKVCLGMELPVDPFLPRRRRIFMAIYSIASVVYRWVVVFSILMFISKALAPYGLKIVGQLLGMVGLFGLVVQPLWQLFKFFHVPGRMSQVKPRRAMISLAIFLALLAGIFAVPYPYYVHCSFTVEPRNAATVYVEVPGQLKEVLVADGQQVARGEQIAVLQNYTLQREISQKQGNLNELVAQLRVLEIQRHQDRALAAELAPVQESIQGLQAELVTKYEELDQLTLVAPQSGTIFPYGIRPKTPPQDGVLPQWTGWPLAKSNRGAQLEEGDAVCRIGDPSDLEAVLVVDQSELEFIARNQTVYLLLESLPGRRVTCQIERIADREMRIAPASLSTQVGGRLPTKTDASGEVRPASASYQASARLSDDLEGLKIGMRGHAKIAVGNRSLAARLWRYAQRTFHFEM